MIFSTLLLCLDDMWAVGSGHSHKQRLSGAKDRVSQWAVGGFVCATDAAEIANLHCNERPQSTISLQYCIGCACEDKDVPGAKTIVLENQV